MTPITSPHNSKLKQLRKLARSRERAATALFVAEGEDLVLAAEAAGRMPLYGFCTPEGASCLPALPPAAAAAFEQVSPELLASVSALASGTRVVGVYEQRFEKQAKGGLCVYLHGVGDPGNVGTVLRSALAFGASSVALGPGCADPHSAKAVRASMGAIFSVALARVEDVAELPGTRVALVAGTGEPLAALAQALSGSERESLTLLVGAERDGLPEQVVGACEHVARIPIASESLNAAMAATVALYEMTRSSSRSTDRGARLAGLRPAAPPSRVPAR
ncbi:MAG TPA: RNA methyltransferase [Solirubrobacteraceae bacterium]|nr:RNA methyltransferase [Solirubrobacteraceae bacterium]